jgi:aryl-alcohol dehydrogenase-like predicted oxidoreductase
MRSVDNLEEDDFRRYHPRFAGDNLEANIAIVEVIDEIATAHDATAAQIALAWVHGAGEDVAPIPGTKRRTYLEQNVGALDVQLTDEDRERLNGARDAVAGDRYADMSSVNR